MPPVFAHGALRLYLLSLLESGPKHGYELIKALSERFGGTYSPSAGTIYPRLGKLEDAGQMLFVHPGPPATLPAEAPAWWAAVADYTALYTPDTFAARSKSTMPRSSASVAWSFGSKSKSRLSPTSRSTTLSSSVNPSGTDSSPACRRGT